VDRGAGRRQRRNEPAGTDGGPVPRIQGFVSTGSALPGGTIDFRVSVEPPRPFRVEVHRIGHYGGEGACLVASSPPLPGLVQPPPLVAGRTVSCHHWWLSWRLRVPSFWNGGTYVAVLSTGDGRRGHIPFTVRDARCADLLLVLPDLTWQAYNAFPQDGPAPGQSPAPVEEARAPDGEAGPLTVSFDRPYAGSGLPPRIGHAHDFVRWADRYGYDLAYADTVDLHAGRVDPTRYRGIVFCGHDEVWTIPVRRAVERARDRGTSLVFLCAGTSHWQAELAPAPSGTPDRLLTCGRRRRDRRARPGSWREAGEPEQTLLGLQYTGRVPEPVPLVVRNADHWLWEATGAGEGDDLPGLVAEHADRYHPRTGLPEYVGRILLAHSPYRDSQGGRRHQETSLYRAPSGALVFASGTFAWSPALNRPGQVDERVRRATANLLDRICKRG
jgi:hypothetical protein